MPLGNTTVAAPHIMFSFDQSVSKSEAHRQSNKPGTKHKHTVAENRACKIDMIQLPIYKSAEMDREKDRKRFSSGTNWAYLSK